MCLDQVDGPGGEQVCTVLRQVVVLRVVGLVAVEEVVAPAPRRALTLPTRELTLQPSKDCVSRRYLQSPRSPWTSLLKENIGEVTRGAEAGTYPPGLAIVVLRPVPVAEKCVEAWRKVERDISGQSNQSRASECLQLPSTTETLTSCGQRDTKHGASLTSMWRSELSAVVALQHKSTSSRSAGLHAFKCIRRHFYPYTHQMPFADHVRVITQSLELQVVITSKDACYSALPCL